MRSLFDFPLPGMPGIFAVPWKLLKTAASLTNKVLTQNDRVIRWVWNTQAYKSDTPAATPNWTEYQSSTKFMNAVDVGGKACLGNPFGQMTIYTSGSMQIGWKITADSTGNTVLSGQEGSATTGWRSIGISASDATELVDGVERYRLYFQVVTGTPAAVAFYGHDITWSDA